MSGEQSPLQGRMIFLVGARRSGTNWLQRILTRHPDVVGLPSETHLFSHGLAPLADRFQHGLPASTTTGMVYMERTRFLAALRAFCDAVFGDLAAVLDPHASRILERTPLHAQYLDLIAQIYPDAHVIHIIRDGRDVARSLVAQPWGPESMADAAAEWAFTIRRARAAQVPQYLEVRYEDLIADPVERSEPVFKWLGLTYDDATRDEVRAEAAVPYNVTSHNPALAVGKWQAGLSESERQQVRAAAGPLLRDLGYTDDAGPPPAPLAVRPPPTATQRAMSAARGFRRRVAPAPASPAGVDMERVARVIDDFLAVVAVRDYQRLLSTLDPDVKVSLVTRDGQRTERGAAGVAALDAALRASESPRHRQTRADAHYGPASSTVVIGYEDAAGNESITMFVFQLAHGGPGTRIAAVTAYGLKL